MTQALVQRADASRGRSILGAIKRLLSAIYRGMERSRQRRALMQLSDARLRDIGLTRGDVARESTKAFWRP